MKGFYLREMGDMERAYGGAMNPRLLDTAGSYLAPVGGVVLFALPRGNPLKPLAAGLLCGVLYGLAIFAVYDLINCARWSIGRKFQEWDITGQPADFSMIYRCG